MQVKLTIYDGPEDNLSVTYVKGQNDPALTLAQAFDDILKKFPHILNLTVDDIDKALSGNGPVYILDSTPTLPDVSKPLLNNIDNVNKIPRNKPYALIEVLDNPEGLTLEGEKISPDSEVDKKSAKALWKLETDVWKPNQSIAKETANQRFQKSLWLAFFGDARLMAYLNPANGIALAAIMGVLASVLTTLVSAEVIKLAAPILLGVGSLGLVFAVFTMTPFVFWEAYKHYQNWKAEKDVAPDANYLDYLSSIPKQAWRWIEDHPVQAVVVFFCVILTVVLIGLSVGVFLNNDIATMVLGPIFKVVEHMFTTGVDGWAQITGLDLSFMSSKMLSVATAVSITTFPLIIADGFRRPAQILSDAQEAGGYLTGGEGLGYNPEDNNGDLRAWEKSKEDFRSVFCCCNQPQDEIEPNLVNATTTLNKG